MERAISALPVCSVFLAAVSVGVCDDFVVSLFLQNKVLLAVESLYKVHHPAKSQGMFCSHSIEMISENVLGFLLEAPLSLLPFYCLP